MLLKLYRILIMIMYPFIGVYLAKRKAKGKEDLERFGERLGYAGKERPDGQLLMMHGASVGESLSMLPLIELLLQEHENLSVLVTTGTLTSAKLMKERLPEKAIHQYVPIDHPYCVKRFLDHWKPDMALWFESDFWANMITQTADLDIPLILINGRISDRSFKRWSKFKCFISAILEQFTLCLGQTVQDVERLNKLGAKKTKCVGNIKFGASPLPADKIILEELEKAFANRPRWLASSTHAGEETIAGNIHKKIKQTEPNLLTVIVPRHPPRGDEVEKELKELKLKVARRSKNDKIEPDTDIYLADTIGELGLFYRLAKIVFVGKTLVGKGGQNPLEAARLGCAVIAGLNMENFVEMTINMIEESALIQVKNEQALEEKIIELLSDSEKCKKQRKASKDYATKEAGVINRVAEQLTTYIEAIK